MANSLPTVGFGTSSSQLRTAYMYLHGPIKEAEKGLLAFFEFKNCNSLTKILFHLHFDVTVQLLEYPFKNGQRLEVVVTEVLSPWEFWVQPVGSELDLLMEEMW